MNDPKHINIRILVDSEEKIYTSYSPEPDLSWSLKAYIKSKTAAIDHNDTIDLTVVSKSHLNEDKHNIIRI